MVLFAAAATPRVARAQAAAPAKVTPSDLRPAAPSAGAISIPSAEGLTAPGNAASLHVTIGSVSVEGGFPELQDDTAAAVSSIRGKRVSLADIYAAANAIETAYSLHGYVLVRVAIPPQKLSNGGALRLVVIDGFVESVDVNAVPERQRALVAQRTAPLIGVRHITLSQIERRLLLASDVPGQTLSSTLARGATPGGTRLVLEATQRLVTGSIGLDNDLPASLRNFEFTDSLAINSVLGFGEQLYGTATTGYNLGDAFNGQSPIQVFGGGLLLPIGPDGLKINPEYTNSVTRPLPPTGTPATAGYFQRFDLRASYPLLLTRAQTITLQATYEWAEEHLVPLGFGTDLYKDRYNALRLQLEDRLRVSSGGQIDAKLAFSQGLGGRDAVQAATSGVPLSQQGSSPTFSKILLNANWSQPLPADFQGLLVVQAQTSFGKPVFISEQLALDGPQAASGYPVGTFTVDEGATLRGEIGRSFTVGGASAQATITPYAFAAGGRGWIDQPTAAQQAQIDVASFGVGFRTGANVTGLPFGGSLSVELARALSNVTGERQGYRGNVAFAVNF